MVRLTLAAAAAAVIAFAANPVLAQSVGKCSYNSITQQWPNPTIVHFDTGKTVIHADDAKKIAETAKLARDHYIQQICVSGFADKEGNAPANMKLSLARGQAVAKQLAQNGADPRTIMINPNGEPGGSFGGGSAQYANRADRRVEIRFTK
ncbi:MAG: OmpA family protein [Alphaproteobacteria bacterium]|nr:OmpA family protein [Alphaproteobacteria bacterium]